MPEIGTYSLRGGRRLARERASSDPTANFATRSGLLVSRKLEWRRRRQWAAMKPTGNDENSSGRFSPGQTQSGSRQSAQLNGKRGWMAPRTSAVSGGRRRILLTSLFIGLPSGRPSVQKKPQRR